MKFRNATVKVRTSRTARYCDNCAWLPSRRGSFTIAPGHRYLRHVAFPDAEGNESGTVIVNNECIPCLNEREPDGGLLIADACSTFCCGDVPCARPDRHRGDHSCRRCMAVRR